MCQWVEKSEGAEGEGNGVLFFRNRNGLGLKPQEMVAEKVGVKGRDATMVVEEVDAE